MKTVVLMSGGLDSSVLAASLVADGYDVVGLGINYGQRHVCELRAADAVASHLGIPHTVADLSALRETVFAGSDSSQVTGVDVPEGHYAEASMKTTVVPNRNMMMLSVAVARAISLGAEQVAYAAHAGDHAVYPDCREGFVVALSKAIDMCDYEPPTLWAPFLRKSKADIAKLGDQLKFPTELTWSCYKGGSIHCGRCSTCVERAEAFSDAGVPDPTFYEDPDYWRGVVRDHKRLAGQA